MNSGCQLSVVASIIVVIGGCAITRDNVTQLSTPALCVAYGDALRKRDANAVPIYAEEATRRSVKLNPAEITAVLSESLRIGMSECAMHASWGLPSITNTTTTAYGQRVQHVWRGFRGRYISTRSNYAYTENGRVVAVQN